MTPGGGRNAQKANRKRREAARKAESDARADLARLKALPLNQPPFDYMERIQAAEGKLNKARDKQRKSENDSMKGKGPN
jgi:hypothetical protein